MLSGSGLLVQRTDKKQVLFSNINRAREVKIVQVLPGSLESSNTLTERRLKTAIATDFLEEPLRIIYQLAAPARAITNPINSVNYQSN